MRRAKGESSGRDPRGSQGTEGPTWMDAEGRGFVVTTGTQARGTGVGHHGGVVGAKGDSGIKNLCALAGGQVCQCFPQALVGADPTRYYQPSHACGLQGPAALDDEGFHYGIFEGARYIGACCLVIPVGAHGVHGIGFESTEAEIEAGSIGHGSWKAESSGVAFFRQCGQRRTTGVGEAKQGGGFIEGFSSGVVQGPTEYLVAADSPDAHELGMPTGDQQGQEGERGWVAFQHGGKQMRFHMMDTEGWHAPGQCQRATDGGPYQQGAHESGTRGVGDAIDGAGGAGGSRHDLLQEGQDLAYMIPGGEFRHHAAVLPVQVDLTVYGMIQQALPGLIDGDAGFVARGFYAENTHLEFSLMVMGNGLIGGLKSGYTESQGDGCYLNDTEVSVKSLKM